MKSVFQFQILALIAGLSASGVSVAAESKTATVTYQDCQKLVAYQPSQGVEYQPGVDAHGRAVVPADLGGGFQYSPPKSFSFPLEFTPIEETDFDQTTLTLGQIRVGEDGRAYLNGKPLQSDDQAALSQKCQVILKDQSS